MAPKKHGDARLERGEASAERASAERASAEGADVVLVNGQTEHGLSVVRLRDERIEVGELRDVREGSPIYGELVKLSPRGDHPLLFDAEVIARGPSAPAVGAEATPVDPPKLDAAPQGGHKGPPRVTSDAFREGWDGIFGTRARKATLN